MFGISFIELCVIAIVALVFVGPEKLPHLMKQFGKFFVQVRRMSSEVKAGFDSVIAEAEKELKVEEERAMKSANPSIAPKSSETAPPDSIST